jgi:hypothetical protein
LTFSAYTARYASLNRGPLDSGIETAKSAELFQYVRDRTGRDDVFIFRRPRALVLMTDRRASAYEQQPPRDEELWSYFRRINARYVIASPLFEEDRATLMPLLARRSEVIRGVFDNGDFQIYELSCAVTRCGDDDGLRFRSD